MKKVPLAIFWMIIFIFLICDKSFSQSLTTCRPNEQFGFKHVPGVLLGYHYPGHKVEIGITKMLYMRDIKAVSNKNNKTRYKPPYIIQGSLSSEFDFSPDLIMGPQATLVFTPFAFMRFSKNNFFGKGLYYTLGHIIAGANAIYYTDFDQGEFDLRPEMGIWQPFIIKNLFKRDFLIHSRVVYGYNLISNRDYYDLGEHEISLKLSIYWKKGVML